MGRPASIGLARNFKRLLEGEEIPRSELSPSVRKLLENCDAVKYRKSGVGWIAYAVPQNLEIAIKAEWEIYDLDSYIELNFRNRIQAAHISGNSKTRSSTPFEGIFVRSIGCEVKVGSEALGGSPRGISHFISYDRISLIKCDCDTIVTIENADSLIEFESCLHHFPDLPQRLLLVLRWGKGNHWIRITQRLEKPIYHFGDYDPKGIAIYIDEVLEHAPDAKLLLPEGYESQISSVGKAELYDEHHRYIDRLRKVEQNGSSEGSKAHSQISQEYGAAAPVRSLCIKRVSDCLSTANTDQKSPLSVATHSIQLTLWHECKLAIEATKQTNSINSEPTACEPQRKTPEGLDPSHHIFPRPNSKNGVFGGRWNLLQLP